MQELRPGRGWASSVDGANTVVSLSSDWLGQEAVVRPELASGILARDGLRGVAFDSSKLGRWDSSLLVFLLTLRQGTASRQIRFDEGGLPEAARHLLSLLPVEVPTIPAPVPRTGFIDRLGQAGIDRWLGFIAATALLGAMLVRGAAALRGASLMRRVDLVAGMQAAGIMALPVVAVVNLLVGAILAFMGEVQLRKFGADLYVADLVGIAVVREMAPLMTAVVMCGRTGGAYAAELATMNGSEETGALLAIGIPLDEYLVMPRVAALTAMMPLLYLYASAIGIIGGLIIAMLTSDVPAISFFHQMRAGVTGGEVAFGFAKSAVFGLFIGLSSCRIGLAAGRSSADVGRAATTATVAGIVGVIVIDAIFALCAHAVDF